MSRFFTVPHVGSQNEVLKTHLNLSLVQSITTRDSTRWLQLDGQPQTKFPAFYIDVTFGDPDHEIECLCYNDAESRDLWLSNILGAP